MNVKIAMLVAASEYERSTLDLARSSPTECLHSRVLFPLLIRLPTARFVTEPGRPLRTLRSGTRVCNERVRRWTNQQNAAPTLMRVRRNPPMSAITVKDGSTIFYKDWGPRNAQPIVFHHGWPTLVMHGD